MKALVISLSVVLMCASSIAYAKGGKRDGFNFGTSLRLMDMEQPGLTSDASGVSDSYTEIQTVRPYLGYVFGEMLHLGIGATFENESRQESVKNRTALLSIDSSRESSLEGAGIDSRFLFGRIMYFEGGVGYYQRRSTVATSYVSDSGQGFSGRKESNKMRSIGLGYHVGGGVELPIAYDFYFTTNYMVYFYNLKPYKNTLGTRSDAEHERQKEVSFGFSHYYR